MTTSYTTESILISLGYADPLEAAPEQARMILLGRLTRYEARVLALKTQWGCTLTDMAAATPRPGRKIPTLTMLIWNGNGALMPWLRYKSNLPRLSVDRCCDCLPNTQHYLIPGGF